MNIRRFEAADMRQALNLIREELGEEAVILETNKTDEGVEVTAAVDFDPAMYIQPENSQSDLVAPAPQDSRLNTEPPVSSYEAIAAAAAAGAAPPAAEPPA
ncbi:MAG: flagellar biosynthesis protein FlhF, partial [Gammaproteobacteria bacterium]|nr:flagellar biosynthesis protein FlhF [Gammaproteobacteria bacterium]